MYRLKNEYSLDDKSCHYLKIIQLNVYCLYLTLQLIIFNDTSKYATQ